ncbi:MAG: hypothetical protein IAE94_06070 [Chthoniobacterales bacterium]|nr:hypothetical protein [Chthoniobacterales bacterium]
MSRRSKKTSKSWILLLAGALFTSVAAYFVLAHLGAPYRTLQPLPVAAYVQNSLSLQGNTYRLSGQIENQMLWDKGFGRVVSILTSEGLVAVVFPNTVRADNLQRGQKIIARAEVGDKGILKIEEFSKE